MQRSLLLPSVWLLGIAGAMVTYATAFPVWIPVVLLSIGPLLWLRDLWIRNPSRLTGLQRSILQSFGLLVVIYSVMLPIAIRETQLEEPADLILASEDNFADAIFELYPDSSEAQFMKARQVGLCLNSQLLKRPMPVACQRFADRDLFDELRRLLRKSTSTGVKHNERYYHVYLELLVTTNADPAEIEAAAAAWKRNFPNSRLPDPRKRQRTPRTKERQETPES